MPRPQAGLVQPDNVIEYLGQACPLFGPLAVIRQEVICRFEPGHRSDVTDAAVRSVPVVVVLPARQSMGPLS